MSPTHDLDGALFEQLRPRLTAISRRIVGSTAEAEDIVQDCFMKWHGADQAALATPVAWLTTVVQRQSIDHLRQRRRDAVAAHGALALASAGAPPLPEAPLLLHADLADALARLHATLSASERMALVLHDACECTHADIAAALSTTPVNARQYLARARRRLRAVQDEQAPAARLHRALIRQFQAAINGRDMPSMMSLLADDQPVSVQAAPAPAMRLPANDACYRLAA